jgi:hypothetical protein
MEIKERSLEEMKFELEEMKFELDRLIRNEKIIIEGIEQCKVAINVLRITLERWGAQLIPVLQRLVDEG